MLNIEEGGEVRVYNRKNTKSDRQHRKMLKKSKITPHGKRHIDMVKHDHDLKKTNLKCHNRTLPNLPYSNRIQKDLGRPKRR